VALDKQAARITSVNSYGRPKRIQKSFGRLLGLTDIFELASFCLEVVNKAKKRAEENLCGKPFTKSLLGPLY
jgi:hypothetical protein